MWFGRRDRERQYRLNDTVLQSEQGKRELGIHVQSSCRAIRRKISRTNGILGFRYRNIDYKGSKMMLNVYKTLVSPQLEFCVQFWSLHFRMWGSLRGCRGDLPEWFQGWGMIVTMLGWRNWGVIVFGAKEIDRAVQVYDWSKIRSLKKNCSYQLLWVPRW